MVRRSTLLCCMLVMIAGTIVFFCSAIFSDDKAANRAVEFVQEEDHSILLSSHITSDLEKIADYITFIHKDRKSVV